MSLKLIIRSLDILIFLGMLLLSLITLVVIMVPQWWLSDLLSHLRVQYALALLLGLLWFGLRRSWLSLLILIPITINLSVLLPFIRPQAAPQTVHGRTITILHNNLDKNVPGHKLSFDFFRQTAPDILLVQELTPSLNKRLLKALPDYRVIYSRPLDNTHGSAILLPTTSPLQVLAVGEVYLPASSPRPLISATLALDGQPFTILSWHVIRPKDAYSEDIQEQEYAAASQWVREQRQQNGYPIIVIGDYNSTPWSGRFQRFLKDSGLRDSSEGFGYQPTWPAYAPALFAIPIDHAVISPDIMVVKRSAGPQLVGDHKPIILEIAFGKNLP